MDITSMLNLISKLKQLVSLLTLQKQSQSNMAKNIYAIAAASLGKHLTLDDSVPSDLGCAEAISFILKTAQEPIIAKGYPGTAGLYEYLHTSGHFIIVSQAQPGDVIISPTGTSTKGSTHGHVGIVGQNGVLSNDSNTGLFLEHYTLESWQAYFGDYLGFPVYFFRAL